MTITTVGYDSSPKTLFGKVVIIVTAIIMIINNITSAKISLPMKSFLSSLQNQVFAGFCALSGVFCLTLPIPIIVNSFAGFYKNRLWRNEVSHLFVTFISFK